MCWCTHCRTVTPARVLHVALHTSPLIFVNHTSTKLLKLEKSGCKRASTFFSHHFCSIILLFIYRKEKVGDYAGGFVHALFSCLATALKYVPCYSGKKKRVKPFDWRVGGLCSSPDCASFKLSDLSRVIIVPILSSLVRNMTCLRSNATVAGIKLRPRHLACCRYPVSDSSGIKVGV